MLTKPLSYKKEEQIKQVAATMSVENMPLTKAAYQNLHTMASGIKTIEQVIAEITSKYKRKV